MPINSRNLDGKCISRFAGRVVRIEETTENRDHSDTLDYTDFRTTQCTYALVWLGTHNFPPTTTGRRGVRFMADWAVMRDSTYENAYSKPRDLEFHEQFAWVDCTNIRTDRTGLYLEAVLDGVPGTFGEPLMWANLIAWDAHQAARREKAAADRAEEDRRRREAHQAAVAHQAARDAKKAARIAASQPAAEALLAKVPPKGTTVTVDGVTGKVAWMGTKVYRGRWSARVGVKDSQGQMHWVDAAKVVR
jgi:hypothetical protein